MERIDYYRQCIRELLTEKSAKEADNPDIECQLIFDRENDHILSWVCIQAISALIQAMESPKLFIIII